MRHETWHVCVMHKSADIGCVNIKCALWMSGWNCICYYLAMVPRTRHNAFLHVRAIYMAGSMSYQAAKTKWYLVWIASYFQDITCSSNLPHDTAATAIRPGSTSTELANTLETYRTSWTSSKLYMYMSMGMHTLSGRMYRTCMTYSKMWREKMMVNECRLAELSHSHTSPYTT